MELPYYLFELSLLSLALLLLLAELFTTFKSKHQLAKVGLVGLLVGVAPLFVLYWLNAAGINSKVVFVESSWLHPFFIYDTMAMLYKTILLLVLLVVILMAYAYRPLLNKLTDAGESSQHTGEYYYLLVLAGLGMSLVVSSVHFIALFAAIELMSITFYVLIAFTKRHHLSLEAAIRYLILGGVSTAFLIYGIAWYYGMSGHLQMITNESIIYKLIVEQKLPGLIFAGILMLIGISFKIGIFPLQNWIPIVYSGASTPVVAFLSVGSKIAAFVVLSRLLQPFFIANDLSKYIGYIGIIMAIITLIFANVAALKQKNIKTVFGYSSMVNAALLMLLLISQQQEKMSFYLISYALMVLAIFMIIVLVERSKVPTNSLQGLYYYHPILAIAATILLAGMAGMPLTAGFFSKLFVLSSVINSAVMHWGVIVVIILGSIMAYYYYFQFIRNIFTTNKELEASEVTVISHSWVYESLILIFVLATIALGFCPQLIFHFYS